MLSEWEYVQTACQPLKGKNWLDAQSFLPAFVLFEGQEYVSNRIEFDN